MTSTPSGASDSAITLPEILFVPDLSRLTGKSITTLRTFVQQPSRYGHLIPQPVRRFPNSRRLYWLAEDVQRWMENSSIVSAVARRPRGRPTKREAQERARLAASLSEEGTGAVQ